MSAFAAIFRRDRGPVSERRLRRLADPLTHRGGDGRHRSIAGCFGVEHLHFWTTPEEIGERQPLFEGDRIVAFDGRIDNRGELLAALEFESDGPVPSDARLILAAHARWGDDFAGHLIGPFALCLFELDARRALLARDPLGDRTLFYAVAGSEVVIGSEEASVLAHPEVSSEPDERRLAHFFALTVPGDGSTFFRDVREVTPGSLLRIDEGSIERASFWTPPEPASRQVGKGDEPAERYRELLAAAVTSRMRSPHPVAIMMSGGLDSTSLAALAAESAARSGTLAPRAVSWVFDRFASCDERAFIEPVVEACELDARAFNGDDLGPRLDGDELCAFRGGPEENPYRRLKRRAYLEAARRGSTAVLNGGSADAFYTGYQRWFVELIRAGLPSSAIRELLAEIRRRGPLGAMRRAGLGQWMRSFRPRQRTPVWLTRRAKRELQGDPGPESASEARIAAACGPRPARGISVEASYAARCGVDLRHPYRDLRLVEFVLSLPACELYRNGRLKPIARRAMVGRLPEEVRNRTEPTRLTPLFEHGLRRAGADDFRQLLEADGAPWSRFVRREWVERALLETPGPAGDVALWSCCSYQLWRRRFDP